MASMMSMRQSMQMICSVCRDDHARTDSNLLTAALCGVADKYMICPCCKKTCDDYKDRNYRRRWRRWVDKQKGGDA